MHLIVGLGNPGKEYEKTRHNAGFIVLDKLKEKWKFPEFSENKNFKSEISESKLKDKRIILAKPTTFMNLSGEAVQKISSFYKIPIENIIVIHDELDLMIGEYKWRHSKDTGSGGHNGIKDIIDKFASMNFPRLKIGVNSENRPLQMEGKDFVLNKFKTEELIILNNSINNIETKINNYLKI